MAKIEVNTAKQTSVIDETKTTHYVILGEGKEKTVINVAEKTYDKVNKVIGKKEDKKSV